MKLFHILYGAQPYPSEQATVFQKKVHDQLTTISAKIDEIENGKEPVYAFRATIVKDAKSSGSEYVTKNPGIMFVILN